jgi:hypothetical protein
MTSERDRHDDGAGWHEPSHLGGDGGARDDGAPRDDAAAPPADEAGQRWEPPGWSLPPAERQVPHPADPHPADPHPADPAAGGPARDESGYGAEQREAGGPDWLGRGGLDRRGVVQQVFSYQGDLVGAQGWAFQHGWTISDGEGPEDKLLTALLEAAPVRLTKDHRPASVLRGRAGTLELVAFDVLYASGRYRVPEYAVTAAPLLVPVPYLRLSPARFWKHRTGGLVQIPSGEEEFDTRWVLLAAEDGPGPRRLAADPTVRALLLGSDDGDEFWTAAGFVAAVRPDGHRPELIEHHARLLAAVVTALAAA